MYPRDTSERTRAIEAIAHQLKRIADILEWTKKQYQRNNPHTK